MLPISSSEERPSSPQDAARADYIGFLHRCPFAIDAYRLGLASGRREDYRLQDHTLPEIDVPVIVLDNDFRDPNLDRYLTVCREYQPRVAILGDAPDHETAARLRDAAHLLRAEMPTVEPCVVAKCEAALDVLPREVIVGLPNGYADIHAWDFSTPADWSGHRVHVLGGSPPRTWEVIQRLTGAGPQRRLTMFRTDGGQLPYATIVGLDWNGLHRVAYKGEYWHRESPHWRPVDRLTPRATVRRGLEEIRAFWRERGIWPTTLPRECYGQQRAAATDEMHDHVCAGCGSTLYPSEAVTADVATPPRGSPLEASDGIVVGYCSTACRTRVLRAGMVQPDI